MVFLHFPTTLTDEELALQAKYVKLRKKKKALLDFTKPKAEPEKLNPLKRSLEPKEATELAKKLVLAGKISVGGSKNTDQKTLFKRPHGLERKLNEGKTPTAIATILQPTNHTTTNTIAAATTLTAPSTSSTTSEVISYTPFTSSTFNSNKRTPKQTAIVAPIRKVDPTAIPTTPEEEPNSSSEAGPSTSRNFNRGGRSGLGYNKYEASNQPKPGHTVHVKAVNSGMRKLTEEVCRGVFGKIGNIVNVTMELDRNCGFVTFDKVELAEKAIRELDKTYQQNILLQVSFARRQPPLSDLLSNPSPSLFWKHLASNPNQQKSNHQDKRSQVSYTDTNEEPF